MASSVTTIARPAARLVGVSAATAALALMLGAGDASTGMATRPTKAEIEGQTRAAVRASRASLVDLRVVAPNRIYSLTVKVGDPAAYLKYRVDTLVGVMNRLTNVQWRFRSRYFAVVDRSGRRVFWVKQLRLGAGQQSDWYVRRALEDCARNIEFDIGSVDPDNVAPPCPAR
jgi:hypothetical protein